MTAGLPPTVAQLHERANGFRRAGIFWALRWGFAVSYWFRWPLHRCCAHCSTLSYREHLAREWHGFVRDGMRGTTSALLNAGYRYADAAEVAQELWTDERSYWPAWWMSLRRVGCLFDRHAFQYRGEGGSGDLGPRLECLACDRTLLLGD